MADFILNQDQLQHIAFSLKMEQAEKNWQSFSDSEKQFVVETFKGLYPNAKVPLNEAQWYNTVGDILGIFDPSGLVDFINGMSYIKQGDFFFGFLSMVAVIPVFGDVIAKPLIGVGKSSKLFKGMDTALALAKNGKTLEAGVVLEKAGQQSSLIAKLIATSLEWGNKLKYAIKNVPLIPTGFKKVLTDWVDLFQKGLTKSQQAKRVAGGYNFASKVALSTPENAVKMIEKMKNVVSSNTRVFKNFKANDPKFLAKYFWPGFSFQVFGKNRDLISLFRRTKFYAGLLDYIGIGNFVGPDELAAKVPNIDQKFQEYVNTPQGQNIWSQEFGSAASTAGTPVEPTMSVSSPQPEPEKRDLLKDLISGTFFKGPLA